MTPDRGDELRVRTQLGKWQERVLNLTKANPLLGINRSRVTRLLVTGPELHVLFSKLVTDEKKLRMPFVRKKPLPVPVAAKDQGSQEPGYEIECGDLDVEAKPQDLGRKLRRIYDNARTTVEERGITTLQLSFGVLRLEDRYLENSVIPLLLVPCQLDNFGPNAPLRFSAADEEIRVNPVLELYLRERHHLKLPAISEDPGADDLLAFLKATEAATGERGWKVERSVWLSTYTFDSLVIYEDLGALADIALSSPVVRVLAGASSPRESTESLSEDALDALPLERAPTPVLSADSSQTRAVVLVGRGRDIVIHGPPGTGKSQTIANLIADALAHDKKVLFVSAKMAALNVVHERLTRLGLGRFCLEAHSTKAGKARIIDDLRKTLEAAVNEKRAPSLDHLEEWVRTRNHLNEYVRELHCQREPLV